ncbi:MAG: ribosome silencing factor [Anaerolineae bacterium]
MLYRHAVPQKSPDLLAARMRGGIPLDLQDVARFITDVLSGRMGADILVLDVSGITIIADYFIIATGDSDRQLKAMSDAVAEQVQSEYSLAPLAIEGTPASGWMLMDYGAIVVHLFSPTQRSRYDLETLWSDARTVVRMA